MASANPAIVPVGSALWSVAIPQATPDVPMLRTTSPTSACSPSAAAMLSPVPAATSAPGASNRASPDDSLGPSTRGSAATVAEGELDEVVAVGVRTRVEPDRSRSRLRGRW